MKIPSDLKKWCVLSCPTEGLRFDERTLQFLDADHDGRILVGDVLAALEFLKKKGVTPATLARPRAEDASKLAAIMTRENDLAHEKPSADDLAALSKWEERGKAPDVAVLGEKTAAAEAALAAVEKEIDAFFAPTEDVELVTDEPDKVLPLKDRLNPRYVEAVLSFAAACVTPLLGERTELSRLDYKAIKTKLAAYRAWRKEKPVLNATREQELEDEERLLRYQLHLGEFLENFVTMGRLEKGVGPAIFQTGTLRIDGRELKLCFHVANEAAHAALADKSRCCVIYLKLTRAGGAESQMCAVVTAGTVGTLYVGRNGVFTDRDGFEWSAVVTKVVESQISLVEAFWAPWRKIGEGISLAVKKFLDSRQNASLTTVQKGTTSAQAGGAALASSVAAIGIGVGMVGAACASVMAAISRMDAKHLGLSILALILLVSLPSVIITFCRLRKRDIGAILNASGWAVNREIRFSLRQARQFTICVASPLWWLYAILLILVVGAAGWLFCVSRFCPCCVH